MLLRNLDVIKKFMAPTPYRQLIGLIDTISPGQVEAEDNGTAYPSLLWRSPQGRFRINSGRDPFREAERQVELWVEKHCPPDNAVVVMIGCSGLAHLQVMSRHVPHGQIIVIEPDPAVFFGMLNCCDLSPLKDSIKWAFCFDVNPSRVAVIDVLKEHLHYSHAGRGMIFVSPALERVFSDEYLEMRHQVETAIKIEEQNRNTEAIYSSLWFSNAVINLPSIVNLPEIGHLANRFSGQTAIVVAAGPGLNDVLPWIRSVAGKYVIIAVGTSLRSLVNYGIEPDFVVAVDSSTEIIPQFSGVQTRHTCLVAAYTVAHQVLDFFPGRTILFTADLLKGFNIWLEQLKILPSRLRVGGTVSLSAIDFAIHLGCRNLILAGLDLALAADGSTHAAGSIYERSKVTTGSWLPVPANNGATVLTSRQFDSYIRMIGEYLAQQYTLTPELTVYNTSANGAKISGTEVVSLQKLAELTLPSVQNEKYEYIFNCMRGYKPPAAMCDLFPHLSQMKKELNLIAGDTALAITAIDDFLAGNVAQVPQELLAFLDNVDSGLKCQNTANLLLGSIMSIFAAEQKKDVFKSPENLMRQSRKVYECLHEYAAWAADKMDRMISNIELKEGEKNGK